MLESKDSAQVWDGDIQNINKDPAHGMSQFYGSFIPQGLGAVLRPQGYPGILWMCSGG